MAYTLNSIVSFTNLTCSTHNSLAITFGFIYGVVYALYNGGYGN